MTQDQPRNEDEALNRAASLLVQALRELQQTGAADEARRELAQSRLALEQLAHRLELQLAQEQEQRLVLAGQLTGLATALDRLVTHLQGLSTLMADLLERLAEPPAATPPTASEPTFPAGGEGVSLTLSAVPGFQVLMDIQKALLTLDQVAAASVERFQEGDSRVQLQLRAPMTAADLAEALRVASGHAFAIEEARPELLRLRLKFVPTG